MRASGIRRHERLGDSGRAKGILANASDSKEGCQGALCRI